MTDERRKKLEEERRKTLDLPDRRKQTYESLETRIDEHSEYLEARLRTFFLKALIAFGVIGVTSALALFGFAYVLSEVKDTREEFTRSQCEAQNAHNEDTSKQLTMLAKADEDNAVTQRAKAEIRRRRDVTLALIDALAPVRDCEYLVKLSVGEATATPVETATPPGGP